MPETSSGASPTPPEGGQATPPTPDRPAAGPGWSPHPGRPSGPPAGPPPGVGWYSGPLPVSGLAPREGIGRAVGRTIAKVTAAMLTIGVLGTMGILAIVVVLSALTQAADTTAQTAGTSLSTSYVAGTKGNKNVLLAIPVTGTILGESDGGGGGLFGGANTYGYTVKEKLEAAAAREDIKGIVLEMDTPGGTIYGARAISDAVAAYKEKTGRPVIAFVRSMSASGGMYAMAGVDRIIADHGTLVGSIGVIFGPLTTYTNVVATDGGLLGGGVTTTGGITQEYVTAGRSKDIGNPYRKLSDEERSTLQNAVENAYGSFVERVAAGRGLATEKIRNDLGALIYDEETAKTKGLVDEIGNRDVAYTAAADAARLAPGNWQVQRLELRSSGLLGLGLSKLTGSGVAAGVPGSSAATGDRASTAATGGLCARGPILLAYYGDPAVLCG